MWRTNAGLLAACAWVAILAASPSATAQGQADPYDDDPPPPPGVELEMEADNALLVNRWILNGMGEAAARKKLESALRLSISRFDQKYRLSPAQKKKLELAGRRDIKRFFDRVEVAKAEFVRVQGDWAKIQEDVSALRSMANHPHTDLFGDDSMLAKTLRKNLTPDQLEGEKKVEYRSKVEAAAGVLHSRLVLGAEQRRKFVDLVVAETPPLGRYGSFDYDAILLQLSRMPREKLRAVLDEGQCHALSLRFEQARRMERVLVSEGYVAPSKASADEPRPRSEVSRR